MSSLSFVRLSSLPPSVLTFSFSTGSRSSKCWNYRSRSRNEISLILPWCFKTRLFTTIDLLPNFPSVVYETIPFDITCFTFVCQSTLYTVTEPGIPVVTLHTLHQTKTYRLCLKRLYNLHLRLSLLGSYWGSKNQTCWSSHLDSRLLYSPDVLLIKPHPSLHF